MAALNGHGPPRSVVESSRRKAAGRVAILIVGEVPERESRGPRPDQNMSRSSGCGSTFAGGGDKRSASSFRNVVRSNFPVCFDHLRTTCSRSVNEAPTARCQCVASSPGRHREPARNARRSHGLIEPRSDFRAFNHEYSSWRARTSATYRCVVSSMHSRPIRTTSATGTCGPCWRSSSRIHDLWNGRCPNLGSLSSAKSAFDFAEYELFPSYRRTHC